MWHFGFVLGGAAVVVGAGATTAVLLTSGPLAGGGGSATLEPTLLNASDLTVSVFAGSAPLHSDAPAAEFGFQDGPPDVARFAGPLDLSIGPDGSVIVADSKNHVVRRIGTDGVTATVAGSGEAGSDDGIGTAAAFRSVVSLVTAADGTIYVADGEASTIRRILPGGIVDTVAGIDFVSCNPSPTKTGPEGTAIEQATPPACPSPFEPAYREGPGEQALFDEPGGIALLNDGTLLVSDWDNSCIRHIDKSNVVTTFAGTCTRRGQRDGSTSDALFNGPGDLAVGPDGTIYVIDHGDSVRAIMSSGTVSTLYRTAAASDGNGGQTRVGMAGIAVDADGFVYVTETQTQVVRQIAPDGRSAIIAGAGGQGFRTGSGAVAQFSYPTGVTVSASGTIFVADYNLGRIFAID